MGELRDVSLQVLRLDLDRSQALGATLGQDFLSKFDSEIDRASEEELAFVLDLTGVEDVNGSFLKATAYWALQCGQAEVRRIARDDPAPWAIRPLKLFPAVTGCSNEVADEVNEFFSGRGVPILHLQKAKDGKKLRSRVLGALDPVLARTLASLTAIGAGTAAELASRSDESISINGWNNRLADLHLLRLATRVRQGKFLIYTSTSDSISIWD